MDPQSEQKWSKGDQIVAKRVPKLANEASKTPPRDQDQDHVRNTKLVQNDVSKMSI